MYATWYKGTMTTEAHTKRDRILTHAQNTLFSIHLMLTSGCVTLCEEAMVRDNKNVQKVIRHSGKVDQA